MKLKFTAREDENTGELGWLDSRINSDAFGPITYGLGLAHDCLEHFAFDGVADEIEAHGAMYYLRYDSGWYNPDQRYRSPELTLDDIASEWINLYNGLRQEGYFPAPRNTRPLDPEIESDIEAIISEGQIKIRQEYDNIEEDGQLAISMLAERFTGFFRIGYRKARRRFKGEHPWELFNSVAKLFERTKPEFEYQEIVLDISLRDSIVKLTEVHDGY